ncbi:MAG: trigger factor [Candidatus Phytoplasma sp.]|nr:trigger factor [Phytoplasma sp.]
MKFEKLGTNRAKFTFEVTPAEFEHGLDHAFEHAKETVEVKGFRKGHVPRNIFEQKFGVEVLYEDALNHVIGHKYEEAFSVEEVEIVGQPQVTELDFASIKRGEPFTFALEVAVKPEVELGQYKGLEIPKVDTEVTEEEVNNYIKTLASNEAALEVKEGDTLENGDTAIFDFEGFHEGVAFEGGKAENFTLEIGSGQFIPGFEEGMLGMKVGEKREVNVVFPEAYHAPELAGKDAVFNVTLHEIKVKITPELNDEWVRTLNKDNIETLEALKEDVKKDLTANKEARAKNEIIDSVLDKAIANAKVDIPQEMIDQEIASFKQNVEAQAAQYQLDLATFITLSGLTQEIFDAQALEQATKRVNQSLVVEAVAKAEKLVATEEEIAERYELLSQQYNMPIDEIKKYVNDDLVSKDVVFQHAVDLMVDSAVQK